LYGSREESITLYQVPIISNARIGNIWNKIVRHGTVVRRMWREIYVTYKMETQRIKEPVKSKSNCMRLSSFADTRM
jgi:hypothetical protein